MSTRTALKREARVALSTRAQPAWFRILKWLIALAVSVLLWRTPQFWWWIAGAIGLSLTVHFIWRWKTKGWTQPWGGWNDLGAASEHHARNDRHLKN
jgi:Flp pilus assembly protein TadB